MQLENKYNVSNCFCELYFKPQNLQFEHMLTERW